MVFVKWFVAFSILWQPSAIRANTIEIFLTTQGLSTSFDIYSTVFESVCNSGNAEYCQKLAFILQKRKDAKAHVARIFSLHARAKNIYQQKCQNNDVYGCQELGIIYQLGYGVDIDTAQSSILHKRQIEIHKSRCEQEDAGSCSQLAYWFSATGHPEQSVEVAKQYASQSFKYHQINCMNSKPSDCYALAGQYRAGDTFGNYVTPNIEISLNLLRKSCDLQYATACITLGNIYNGGQYVKRDNSEFVRYNQKACDLDNSIGCSNLLVVNKTVLGVKRDKFETAKLRQRIAMLARLNCYQGKLAECNLLYIWK